MASTPATSFNSEDSHKRAVKGWKPSSSKLPSPERSDTDTHSDRSVVHSHDHDRDAYADADADNTAFDHAYQTIWRSFCGLPAEQACPTFRLHYQNTYERLYQRLAETCGLLEYYEQEIRKDWNPKTGNLTLRLMPSTLHEIFKENLGRALFQELDRIAEGYPSLRPFCGKIISAGHAQVRERARQSQARAPPFDRSPDGQLQYTGKRYPHVIIEIAYSQDKRSLDGLVTEYFEQVSDKFCTFLAFDIDYAYPRERRAIGHKHPASVSLWTSEPDLEDPETINIRSLMDKMVFRDKDAMAMPRELTLPFRLLVPTSERNKIPDTDAEVCLPFARLAEFVDQAEQQQRANEASATPEPRPRKFRWLDKDGVLTRETTLAASKRRRTSSASASAPLSVRTRTAVKPRRSSRLHSTSKDAR